MTTEDGEGSIIIPVEPAADVGSEPLAAALAAADVPAIGQALRHDYVVVPSTRGADGTSQVAVFGADGVFDLLLFSSAATFAAWVGDAPHRDFTLRTGASLVPFIEAQRSRLNQVVFDAAGPHPMTASVEDVLESLRPRETDDGVAWVAGTTDAAPSPGDRTVALDLPLTKDWGVIELTDPASMEKQAGELVKAQLKGLPRSPALRGQLTRWLVTSGRTAAAGGGRFMAFLLRRSAGAAVALNVTMYWHELGPQIGGRSHLDAITDRVRARLRDGDELVGARTPTGPFVRHCRREQGAREVGGQDTQVLVTDYWLQFPDERGLCLLSFSSPHLDLREQIHLFTDNIVLGASWVMEPPAAG